jgi:hypothetical protein
MTQFTKLAMDTKNNDDPYVASVGGDLPWLPERVFGRRLQSRRRALA